MPHPSRRLYVKRMQELAAKEIKEKREKREKGIDWRDS